jgi:RNA polymerase sigma-70 factor (ECF subfamily)
MDERKLVRLAQDGSEEAFASLVRAYQARVYSMALNFTRNREVADDLAQEVFLKTYLALPKFRFHSEFGTWLYRIAVNHIKDYLRRKGRAKEVPLDDVREIANAGEEETLVREKERSAEARRGLVLKVLQALPEKYRVILTLRDIQGMPYDQIASVLKISPGTVDSRLHRARKMLRLKLGPYLTPEGGYDAV